MLFALVIVTIIYDRKAVHHAKVSLILSDNRTGQKHLHLLKLVVLRHAILQMVDSNIAVRSLSWDNDRIDSVKVFKHQNY